ncbi:MAG: hypothetical protein L6428_06580 [Candidatus Aminicenantes bacterium]|nr:hypothetical protein [Acidobacteriota bacterium]MCG2811105.1 hypothetical protein [Candidatus Aminicenantes bacterium]
MKKILKKTQELLNKYSTGRNVLALFVITQIIYGFMLLYTIPNVMNHAKGMKLLDMQPTGYNAEYAKNLFDNLGASGREAYLFRQIPVDMIYPFLFAVTYSLLLTFLFKKSFNPKSKINGLSLIPIVGGLFDYLENVGIIIMLSLYPIFSESIANITNVFSVLKSIFITLFFVLLVVGIVGLIAKKVTKLKNKAV